MIEKLLGEHYFLFSSTLSPKCFRNISQTNQSTEEEKINKRLHYGKSTFFVQVVGIIAEVIAHGNEDLL